jgi:hypothetical protein
VHVVLRPPTGAGSAADVAAAGACAHCWACPVIMKTVPDQVAWTCAHCRAIATMPIGLAPGGSGWTSETAAWRPRFAA